MGSITTTNDDYSTMGSIITSISDEQFVVPLYLDGKHKLTGDTFDVVSPATNKTCWRATSATEQDAIEAIESADKAFKSWRKVKPRVRRDIFLRARDILVERFEQSRQFSQTETGVKDDMFGFEYKLSCELLLFMAGITATVTGSLPIVEGEDSHAMVLKEPYGVILAIAPWNAPHILGLRACILPLAAGNTVVLKGPELAPCVYHNFVEALHKAGLPPGCLNTIFHRPSDAARITKLIIEHPAIQKINFTGSTGVGSTVAALCGKNLKQCLMELGGKAPAIVCDDANLDLAAATCAFGAFHHSGQICMSTERILVFESVAEQFTEKLRKAMDMRAAQDPSKPLLVSTASAKKNKALLADAISKGAEIIYGSQDTSFEPTARLSPLILSNITPAMTIYATESFGPSVSLYTVHSDDEAIALANDTEYGLTSAVFTTDLARGFKFAREIVSGAVHINSATVHDEPVLPHGGVKGSGFGRFSGRDCLNEWTRTKVVTWVE